MEALTAGRRKGLWVTDRLQREAGEREHTRAFKGKPPSDHYVTSFMHLICYFLCYISPI